MSRRDYIATAEIIRELHLSPEQRAEMVSRFVTMFADDNPRFSPSKFREACEPETQTERDGYPADNPCTRLDILASLRDSAETAEDRGCFARAIERLRNGAEPEESERDRIEARGYSDGNAAGSWVTDGNTRTETYRALLAGIEEGDPMILDTFPAPSLGGEWADSPTWSDVLAEEGCEDSDDGRADLLDVYESAFADGVTDEVTRACRYQLDDTADLQR